MQELVARLRHRQALSSQNAHSERQVAQCAAARRNWVGLIPANGRCGLPSLVPFCAGVFGQMLLDRVAGVAQGHGVNHPDLFGNIAFRGEREHLRLEVRGEIGVAQDVPQDIDQGVEGVSLADPTEPLGAIQKADNRGNSQPLRGFPAIKWIAVECNQVHQILSSVREIKNDWC